MPRSSNKAPVKIDKYNQAEPKIHPVTWISIASFFVIIIALLIIFTPNNQEKIYKAYTTYGVTTLPKDHPLYQVSYDGSLFRKGAKDIIEDNEVVILYIGYAQCPDCQSHITPFSTYFESTGMDEYVSRIYYIDVTQDPKGTEALVTAHPEFKDTTPQIALFINGEVAHIYVASEHDISTSQKINQNVRGFYEEAIDLINA
ncbi:MAG: hypothetical protein WC992_02530 [Acholeplasmataceae bacterium]|jgi:hypothetical protein|nr:hypothetical protein [Acholeplasmataceae bacterium]